MNLFIETALKNFCSSHRSFGASSSFVRFEEGPESNGTDRDGFNSGLLFGRVVYRTQQNEEKLSEPLALKSMRPEHICKDYMQVQFFNEIFYYTRAMPTFHKLSPLDNLVSKFYDSFVHSGDENTEIVLIYEDLKAQGYRMYPKYSFLDLEHLTLMFHKLGQFHSYSYLLKCQNPIQFQALEKWFQYPDIELFRSVPNYFRLFGEVGVRQLRKDPKYNNRMAKVEEALANAEANMIEINTMDPEEPVSVLIHGDYLRGNVMFKYENEKLVDMKMIDMATCRIASPAIDLCSLLYMNADQKTRNQHWNQLIDVYYGGLCELFGGKGVPNKEDILKEFTKKALHGYFITTHYLQVLMEMDRGNFLNDITDFIPPEYAVLSKIPENDFKNYIDQMSSEESAEAMADILRDIIDRNFI